MIHYDPTLHHLPTLLAATMEWTHYLIRTHDPRAVVMLATLRTHRVELFAEQKRAHAAATVAHEMRVIEHHHAKAERQRRKER